MKDYIQTINESIDALIGDIQYTDFLTNVQKKELIILLNVIRIKTKEVKTKIDEYIINI